MRPDHSSLERVRRDHFPEIPAYCGNDESPGIDEVEEWRDWYARPTTADQNRIESYLDDIGVDGLVILHIGVGNSSLATRYAGRASEIIGTTISPNEKRLADSLNLPGYSVHLQNKYLSKDRLSVPRGVNLIVDNNPTSFCCCWRHFCAMMLDYAAKLRPGGTIISDKVGLGWVVSTPGVNQRWRFSFRDLVLAGKPFGLEARRVDEFIYLLGRPHGLVGRAWRNAARLLSASSRKR